MKKAEILPNMTAIWLQNQTTELLIGTDRRKFTLSVLVEAEIHKEISARNRNLQVIFY